MSGRFVSFHRNDGGFGLLLVVFLDGVPIFEVHDILPLPVHPPHRWTVEEFSRRRHFTRVDGAEGWSAP